MRASQYYMSYICSHRDSILWTDLDILAVLNKMTLGLGLQKIIRNANSILQYINEWIDQIYHLSKMAVRLVTCLLTLFLAVLFFTNVYGQLGTPGDPGICTPICTRVCFPFRNCAIRGCPIQLACRNICQPCITVKKREIMFDNDVDDFKHLGNDADTN